MRHVVVFDTNVLFSAIGWKGKPYQCLELARRQILDGVTRPELLEELASKLQSKLHFTLEQVVEIEIDLLTFLRIVPITGELKVIAADPDDDKTVECAVVAQATHVVTGDRRHLLPLGKFQGIQLVTPTEFLALVEAI